MSAISLPQATSSIGWHAFYRCNQLENFIIPEMTERLPWDLLADSKNLSYVYIPANVKEFESSVFENCKALSVINCRIIDIDAVKFTISKLEYAEDSMRTEKWIEWRYEQFNGIPDTCMWRIPEGCKERYMAQPWWVPTWRIIEANDPSPYDPTDIHRLEKEIYQDKHIYDIYGRRLSAPRKGINIIGGKKVLIK